MIIVWAAMMLAPEFGDTAVRNNLSTCLIYSSRIPPFASENSEQIGQDPSFLKAALSYCSEEVLPYWDVAHERAKTQLGIRSSSKQPLSPQDAAKLIGEQDAAEKQMLSIVAEAWKEARARRQTAPAIPDSVAAKFTEAWLSDDENRSLIDPIVTKPIECIDAAAKAGSIDAGGFMTGKLDAKSSIHFKEVAQGCGYMDAVSKLSGLARLHLGPSISARIAESAVSSYLTQLTFWSFTAGP
jgi:hypothetical protein